MLLLTEEHRYEEALRFLSGVKVDSSPDLLIAAATCYLMTEQLYKALEVLCRAEERGWMLPKICVLKGKCLFLLKEYRSAYASFQSAYSVQPNQEIKECMEKCLIKVNSGDVPVERTFSINAFEYSTHQTDTHFVLNVKAENVNVDMVNVVFEPKTLQVKIYQSVCAFAEYNLFKEIVPTESSYKVTESSVEISLKKAEECEWESLERNDS